MSDIPMREIILLMSPERAQAFGDQIAELQAAYGTSTVTDTIERAVNEARIRQTLAELDGVAKAFRAAFGEAS